MPRTRALLAISLVVLFACAAPASAASPDVVISQVYGGGGNAGATYKNDFIELFNRGTCHGSRAARAREALLPSAYRAGGGVLLPFATGTAPAATGSPASMR